MTLWEKFEQFPPILCRLLARTTDGHGVRALSVEEISRTSELDGLTVRAFSWLPNWEYVTLADTEKFMRGCNVDIGDRNNLRTHTGYIRGNAQWKYLKKHPDWLTVYEPMIKAYVEYQSGG